MDTQQLVKAITTESEEAAEARYPDPGTERQRLNYVIGALQAELKWAVEAAPKKYRSEAVARIKAEGERRTARGSS